MLLNTDYNILLLIMKYSCFNSCGVINGANHKLRDQSVNAGKAAHCTVMLRMGFSAYFCCYSLVFIRQVINRVRGLEKAER